jgi:hypothetical protein
LPFHSLCGPETDNANNALIIRVKGSPKVLFYPPVPERKFADSEKIISKREYSPKTRMIAGT